MDYDISTYQKKLVGKIGKLNKDVCIILEEVNYSSNKKNRFLRVLTKNNTKIVSRDIIKIL